MGFLTEADMPELIRLDRLFPVLVRCGGCRFTCGAQYLEHLMACIKAGGDYVRDVSFPVGSMERAEGWRAHNVAPDPDPVIQTIRHGTFPEALQAMAGGLKRAFDESQCGGVFDGNTVTSDADPGL
jgi:hypothetical protein